jgi:hypothetical protein
MNNKDNQLETIELGWLAGMIEGDGFLSVTMAKDDKSKLKYQPRAVVGVTNQDIAIINKVDDLFRKLGVIAYIREHRTPKGKPISLISTSTMANVKRIVDAIKDHLIGEKRARAELVKKFVDSRLSRKWQNLNEDEIDIIRQMDEQFVSRKGKETGFNRFLREQNAFPKKDDVLRTCGRLQEL